MYAEAPNAYTVIVKNKQYLQAEACVNMGNIYFEQKKYMNAIKNYQMADQIPELERATLQDHA